MLFLTKGGIYEVTLHLPKCFIYYWTILYFIRIRWFIASNCSSSSILYYWSNLFNEIINRIRDWVKQHALYKKHRQKFIEKSKLLKRILG